jgi:WXG100 family type VII secretion target
MNIQLTHEAFRRATHHVRAGCGQLKTDRDRVDREVDSLLQAGWTGIAADSFIEGWADWRVAAQEVLDGLVAMGQLLSAAHQDFIESDADSQTRLDQVAARIVQRLG